MSSVKRGFSSIKTFFFWSYQATVFHAHASVLKSTRPYERGSSRRTAIQARANCYFIEWNKSISFSTQDSFKSSLQIFCTASAITILRSFVPWFALKKNAPLSLQLLAHPRPERHVFLSSGLSHLTAQSILFSKSPAASATSTSPITYTQRNREMLSSSLMSRRNNSSSELTATELRCLYHSVRSSHYSFWS